jgi:hypothetical protein
MRKLLFVFLLMLAAPARSEPLPTAQDQRSWSAPRYEPSSERTQRGYLPSFQREQQRRAICERDYCDERDGDFNRSRRKPERPGRNEPRR